MSDLQPFAHLHHQMFGRFHRYSGKELFYAMDGDENVVQRDNIDNQSNTLMILTHYVCNELKRTGTPLIHSHSHERTQRDCSVYIIP